jgi:hypothetical protein
MNWRQRMKFRHNKKRNPAFIFEALTREFAKAKLHNDKEGLKKIKKIMQEVFNKDGLLYKQLRLYKALTETRDVDYLTAEKIIAEVHRVFSTFEQKLFMMSKQQLFIKLIMNLRLLFLTNMFQITSH